MYHTTGLSEEDIRELAVLVAEECKDKPGHCWPPSVGLLNSIVITLTYARRNRVQAEIAEAFNVSQPTVSRAISRLTPVLAKVLADRVPVADDLDMRQQYIIDGTLLPCWSWADHPDLYSGKHKTTGLNVQVACDLTGRLAWVSDPVPGARHDVAALRMSGILDADAPQPVDRRQRLPRIRHDPANPQTRLPQPPRLGKKLNTAVNRIRWRIEQTIANLKTWRVLHTDYRRPLDTFATTISAVLGLESSGWRVNKPHWLGCGLPYLHCKNWMAFCVTSPALAER